MGAETGTSLLPNVALLAFGFLLGRVQFLPIAMQLVDEVSALSTTRKVAISVLFAALIALYVLVFLLPLDWIARKEATRARQCLHDTPTSFRRELRRRGSYSMSYVTDIKAHVFARS
uniref:Uncharacterized protein n=1 Tax=Globisporangium ultimum (strain ATCC 200006 / CBS 805.95 / DAOM BR144) TaxID=431595 RepID=K3X256_GLOUD